MFYNNFLDYSHVVIFTNTCTKPKAEQFKKKNSLIKKLFQWVTKKVTELQDLRLAIGLDVLVAIVLQFFSWLLRM